jgi:rod shape-determining protein MreD
MYSVIAGLLAAHLALLKYINISGYTPDLMLIAVLFIALFFGSGAGLEAGIAAGIGKDVFAMDYMGINTLSMALTGLVVGALHTKFFKDSKLTRFIVVFFFSAFSMSVHLFAYDAVSSSQEISFLSYAASPLLPVSIYTALLAVPLFPVLERLFGVPLLPDVI